MDCPYAHRSHSTPLTSYPSSEVHDSAALWSTFRHEAVPLGFPPSITSKQAWHTSEFLDENSFILHLSKEDKDELDTALVFFKGIFDVRPRPHGGQYIH
jgi:hypothetical protein